MIDKPLETPDELLPEIGADANATVGRADLAREFVLEDHPAHIVRRVHQRAGSLFQRIVDGDALSPTQFAALATLLKHAELSQAQLCRLTAMDPSTGTIVLRKLIQQGLVRKSKSHRDSRLSLVSLTETGQAFTAARLKKSLAVGQALLEPLSEEEQTQLIVLLKRLYGDDESTE